MKWRIPTRAGEYPGIHPVNSDRFGVAYTRKCPLVHGFDFQEKDRPVLCLWSAERFDVRGESARFVHYASVHEWSNESSDLGARSDQEEWSDREYSGKDWRIRGGATGRWAPCIRASRTLHGSPSHRAPFIHVLHSSGWPCRRRL